MAKKKRVLCLVLIPLLLLSTARGVSADSSEIIPTTVVDGEVNVSSRIWELLFGRRMENADAAERLVVGGDVFGARMYQGYIELSSDIEELGLKARDIIRRVDGEKLCRVRDLAGALEIGDKRHTLSVERDGALLEVKTEGADDCRRVIGAARDGAAGIGTVTYIDPSDLTFGGLGHGIWNESGEVLPLESGKVTGVIIGGAVKGEKGQPGELSGILTDRGIGEITKNTGVGLFGRLSDWKLDKSSAIPIAKRDEVKVGAATIISTVKNGKKMSYSVELYDINTGETGTKCFKIRVTDKALIAMTGGIVRGMSGSPIIQDGKLVGAVTHVMVANPTEGYGIFIENMLDAAQGQVQPKAA